MHPLTIHTVDGTDGAITEAICNLGKRVYANLACGIGRPKIKEESTAPAPAADGPPAIVKRGRPLGKVGPKRAALAADAASKPARQLSSTPPSHQSLAAPFELTDEDCRCVLRHESELTSL